MTTFLLKNYRINKQYSLQRLPEKPMVINTINPHSMVVAEHDQQFRNALTNSDILIPDGIGIVLAARILWGERFQKFSGYDLHEKLLSELAKTGGSCFYMGASPTVLEKIKERLAREYPGIRMSGYAPPYKPELSDEDNETIIEQINIVKPDVLFIGMTAPKQEKWLEKCRHRLQARVMCSIGGAFDFYAGTIPHAPAWVISAGLEWLYRLLREPRRMWRRNFISTPTFMRMMVTHRLRKKVKIQIPVLLDQS
ncbi:N-acetylglucosaminyldiphosphoundecaprenol N-acetyl-beta-D-mannosaminyltransferase [Chitinophaga costaii]|uniref:N-acetylglucosaminyldiphosphoundecaprenol N-acetyl-beta-D-mannosaminyltransferase n=1 Tax=Chitinophaga costaii TaxID=1335309 RepID=A0A1C3ZAN8_9BACT|nr:WecB/TagA/CpsF family glycosyltransferase [Chitinophaga costaii]PUZ30292.1 glycosyltransferase [Chitinophaga costaii]SCB79313.1 N-acetylglucosaminyldiphosphoundecaprenol N-acetyl-beta-D-mannosaminyltransferase [Chitinophaga costaii]